MAYPDSERAPEERAPPGAEGRATNQVRQGVTGHNVRYVLAFGLGGVVLAFALIYAAFWA